MKKKQKLKLSELTISSFVTSGAITGGGSGPLCTVASQPVCLSSPAGGCGVSSPDCSGLGCTSQFPECPPDSRAFCPPTVGSGIGNGLYQCALGLTIVCPA